MPLNQKTTNPKVALVHDFLTQLGGAERVLDEFHELFPQAPIFTLVYDEKKTLGKYKDWNIKTSFIQKLPGGVSHYKWYLALMPYAVHSFDLSGFDVVLSDVSAFAKGIKKPSGSLHVSYCHTPTRYLWQDKESYLASQQIPGWIKLLARPLLSYLRRWDYRAAQKIDVIIANSTEVKTRIAKYYKLDSEVIYPPVDSSFFVPTESPVRDYFLIAGRLEPYKKSELAIEAATQLGLPVRVAGTGTMYENLKKRYESDNVKFYGRVSDEKLRWLYQNAKALLFPAKEDAGIAVLESLACGTPVVAYRRGGASEFVREGVDGLLVSEQSVEAFKEAVENFSKHQFDSSMLRAQARAYDKNSFRKRIYQILISRYENRS